MDFGGSGRGWLGSWEKIDAIDDLLAASARFWDLEDFWRNAELWDGIGGDRMAGVDSKPSLFWNDNVLDFVDDSRFWNEFL
jgi:hypothetical protein